MAKKANFAATILAANKHSAGVKSHRESARCITVTLRTRHRLTGPVCNMCIPRRGSVAGIAAVVSREVICYILLFPTRFLYQSHRHPRASVNLEEMQLIIHRVEDAGLHRIGSCSPSFCPERVDSCCSWIEDDSGLAMYRRLPSDVQRNNPSGHRLSGQ